MNNVALLPQADMRTSVPVQMLTSPRFDVNDSAGFNQYLDKHGYVLIANVASAADIEQTKCDFWKYYKHIVPEVRENDASTWNDTNWLGDKSNGILNSFGFNHSPMCWRIRCLPKVKKAFGSIWDTESLLVSFDACNVFRPWKINREFLTNGGWWHVDQNHFRGPNRQGKVCIQGLVTLYGVTKETGGLCVIPGSHLYHEEFCSRIPSVANYGDFLPIAISDEILQTCNGNLIGAQAGDLILWDSRTIHCNTPAPAALGEQWAHDVKVQQHTRVGGATLNSTEDEIIRLVAYVCMVPKSLASRDHIRQRKFQFCARMGTSHWPINDHMLDLLKEDPNPAHYTDAPIDPKLCSWEMLQLVGYSEEEIKELHTTPKFFLSNPCSLM